MQLHGGTCLRPIFAEVTEETRCALVGSLNTVCGIWGVSKESSVDSHWGITLWDPWHPSMTLSALILSAPSSSGVLAWIPCPREESSSLASAHSSSSSVTHGASLECRYPSLEMLPSKPAGCPGWLGPTKPSCCCPSLLPWHSRQLWSLFPSSGFMHSHFGCTTQPQTSTGIHYRGQSNSGTVGV